ncbi:MAG: hypothetical protein ACRDOK_26310 [Streptosporangiaceae bacterium]
MRHVGGDRVVTRSQRRPPRRQVRRAGLGGRLAGERGEPLQTLRALLTQMQQLSDQARDLLREQQPGS